MNSEKLRMVLLGTLGLSVIVFVAICILGLSALQSKSKTMVDLKTKNHMADDQLSNLEASKKQVEKYSYFKSVASSAIPNDKDQAQAVLDITQMADQAGISLQSIAFPTSNLGIKSLSTGASSSNSKAAISQAQPVKGIPGLYSVQLIITPQTGTQVPPSKQVTFAKMLDFLNRIENDRRTAQITQVNIQPVENAGDQINFTLTLNSFIKP